MKFDQAIKEGFANYVSEDEDQISIGRDVLESIRDLINDDDVVKIAVEKHRDNPNLFKAINKLIFKVDSLLDHNKKEFAEDEITSATISKGASNTEMKYDVDKVVEKEAEKASTFGKLGFGKTGKSKRAVAERDKLVGKAVDIYNNNTKEIEKALQAAS